MTTATFGPITSLCVGARTPEGLERIMRDLASEGAQSHISAATAGGRFAFVHGAASDGRGGYVAGWEDADRTLRAWLDAHADVADYALEPGLVSQVYPDNL